MYHRQHDTWPQRFLRAIPPMPDGVWVGVVLLMVFGLGVSVGMTLCVHQRAKEVSRVAMPASLDTLEQRVRALEQRQHQEGTP